jgi:uncharacterized protein YcaQ
MPAVVSACQARILLMQAQGLLDDPRRPASTAVVSRLIRRLGFVQVDSINVVERGHHLTLGTRLQQYRPSQLAQLIEGRRSLFEHWTHDASVIPTLWFAHWKPRFRRFAKSPRRSRWIEQRLGEDPKGVLAHVERRLRREGPLMSKHFETERGAERQSWWGWTPQKTALEYLWHAGRVTITARQGFHKVYDLTRRVYPELCRLPTPRPAAQREWACWSAMERLEIATPGEIAHFWDAVTPADATLWCRAAERTGRIVAVEVEDELGAKPRRAFARPDWQRRAARAPAPPSGLRLLSPFDPVIRDRRRLLRRFGFDYHFEAFVPPAKRKWGYYVMPVLDGDRFVARVDPKLHRDRETLELKSVYWEPGIRPTRARQRDLEAAAGALGELIGARNIELPPRSEARRVRTPGPAQARPTVG